MTEIRSLSAIKSPLLFFFAIRYDILKFGHDVLKLLQKRYIVKLDNIYTVVFAL